MVICPLPATAATPSGATGAGRVAASVMVILVEVNPVAVAVRMMEPAWLVDWTITWARPLNTERWLALSAS